MSVDVWCVLVGALGGTIFGYSTGIIGGVSTPLVCQWYTDHSVDHNQIVSVNGTDTNICGLPVTDDTLKDIAKLTSSQTTYQGLLTACILLGAFFGAFLGPAMANRFGRKVGLLATGLIAVATSIGLALVNAFWAVIAIRTVQGVAVGFSATIAPLYVSEMASEARRAKLGSVFQVFICGSILVAQFINYMMVPPTKKDLSVTANDLQEWSWHLQLGLCAVPGALLVIISQLVPESTVWQTQSSESINHSEALSDPLADSAHGRVERPSAGSQWSLLFSKSGWRWCWIAFILSAANQLTGINGIVFYAPAIFSTHFPEDALVLTFTAVGAWNFLSVFISFFLVDRFSRKNLLLVTLALMTLATAVLGITDMNVDWPALPTVGPYVSIIAVILFIGAFECGTGPLFWVMAVELFPPHIEQAALSFTNATVWICNIALTFSFPIIANKLGQAGTFYLLSGIALLATLLIWRFVPADAAKESAEDEYENDAHYDEEESDSPHYVS